jgi:tetratricopeptide (TPR) repeat protein
MKVRLFLSTSLTVVAAMVVFRTPDLLGAVDHNLVMRSVLSILPTVRFSLSGFSPCVARDALHIPRANELRKQAQGQGLFLGVMYWLAGDCEESLGIWDQIYRSSDVSDDLSRNTQRALALGYAEQRNWEHASLYLRQTDGAAFAREVGNRATRAGDLRQAADWYEINFEIDPSYDAAQRLVNVLTQENRQQEIVGVWQELVDRSPKASTAYWLGLAKEAEARDDCADAVPAYQEAVRLEPRSAPSIMSLAGVLRHCGDYAGAFQAYLKAVDLTPTDNYALAHVGITAYENHDFPNAYKYLQESIAVRPNVLAFDYLSRVASDEGETEFAIGYMLSALKLGERSDLYLQLGDLYLSKGSLHDAEQAFRRSLELQPTKNPASERLHALVAP